MFCKPLERSILRFWFSRRFRSRLRFSVMLDGHPILCDPPPSPLGQLMRIPYPFLRCHLTEPVLKRVRHVDLLPVAPYRGLPVHQPTERRFGVGRIMFGVVNVNGPACPGGHEYLHGGMAVAAGPAIEGFSNVRVRLDFPARNGLTKFGVGATTSDCLDAPQSGSKAQVGKARVIVGPTAEGPTVFPVGFGDR